LFQRGSIHLPENFAFYKMLNMAGEKWQEKYGGKNGGKK
jgi:hypothetical protein